LPDFSTSELLDGLLQGRISLAHNRVKPGCSHSSILHLFKWPASFDRLVLTGIAHQNDAVILGKTIQKLVDLSGAGQTGLVHEVNMPAPTIMPIARQVVL
jgi:hypothetical protein